MLGTCFIVIVNDVRNNLAQDINPLTREDLKKKFDQSTHQAKLCDNLVLVSVDELQKVVADITRDKVNTQEPPSIIPIAITRQPQVQASIDTSTKVDTIVKVIMIEQQTKTVEETTKEQVGQIDASVPTIQTQCASQIIVIH